MAVAEGLAKTQRGSAFLSSPRKMLINGEWVESASGKTFPVYNPATGEEMIQVAEGDTEDINRAVAAARKAFEEGPWSKTTPNVRGKMLWKLSQLIEENADTFAELEALDNGKACTMAKAVDVAGTVEHFQYMAGWATKVDGRTMSLSTPDTFGFTLREPVGVCGQIIPWNFPLMMAAWKLGPALACGNAVVLKPAEQTPLTALLLGEMIQEAGFPDGVVNIVPGYGETAGAALSGHPDVDKIAFTGSTEVGRLILQAASGNLKKVSLELGGKAPNIVFSDADIGAATAGAAMGIFFNQGQVCCAGSRLYVEKKEFDTVVGGLVDAANKMNIAPGMDPACELGPLVSDVQLERVTGFVERGKEAGAEALVGGDPVGGNGYFYKPTVLTNVNPDMEVVREEIFGPVVVAQPFDDIDELARQANDTPYGLSAGIWTSDISKAHKMASKLKAGTVWINCYNVFDPHLPFGGYKQSGIGREMGSEVLDLYTEVKAVCIQL
ncbi:MAG: aldehyde dehydrogenase family protein [Candidatus Hydrogenedentes bacterium]|nr:aldehyde dehydrogenase family protein [Candidatus Hydrogenedentota bacterium]